jgi:5-methylcytosine-specific restriction endonuclease McrA
MAFKKWGSTKSQPARTTWKPSPTERRTSGLPVGWKRLREQILKRDDGQCTAVVNGNQRCPYQATHVDHIVPSSKGGSDEPANLTSLCARCHQTKTSKEANAARQQLADKAKRKEETHPGLID